MSYVEAENVRSPRAQWALIQVLVDQGQSDDKSGKWSLAIGDWEGERRLAVRWNGTEDRPAGNPQSRGIATWFVLPDELAHHLAMEKLLPSNKLALAMALLHPR